MRNKFRILPVVLIVMMAIGCARNDAIKEQADKLVPATTSGWFAIQDTLQGLHTAGVLKGAEWNHVVDLLNGASKGMRILWATWAKYHTVSEAVNDQDFLKAYSDVVAYIAELTQIMNRAQLQSQCPDCYYDPDSYPPAVPAFALEVQQ